jgi:Alkylmercury lyase
MLRTWMMSCCGCAWDSDALPQLLGGVVPGSARVLVATTCPACGSRHAWNVDAVAPPEGDQVAHFLVPAAHIWDDVVHTCSHQRSLYSTDCLTVADLDADEYG